MKKLVCLLVIALSAGPTFAADAWGLKEGKVALKSADVLTFGPENILFVGDTKGAVVHAIATTPIDADGRQNGGVNVKNLSTILSDMLSGPTSVNDLTVNPATGELFLACSTDGKAALVQVSADGREMKQLELGNAVSASVALVDAPEDKVTGEGRRKRNNRSDAITDLAWFEGKLLISGLRSAGAASSVREIAFPFAEADKGVGIQIYHAAHGREEDYSAMRTFVPMTIDGEPTLLGAYICTPLVKIPLTAVSSGKDLKATTVAELGNRNRPLDMVSYSKGGDSFLLLSNSARGVMKISTAGLSDNPGLTERVGGGGTAGQSFETVEDLQGVVQMAKLDDSRVVVLLENDGQSELKTVTLP